MRIGYFTQHAIVVNMMKCLLMWCTYNKYPEYVHSVYLYVEERRKPYEAAL